MTMISQSCRAQLVAHAEDNPSLNAADQQHSTGAITQSLLDIEGLKIDFSKTHLDRTLLDIYSACADDIQFDARRRAFLNGEAINATEGRAVLHTLLRGDALLNDAPIKDELLKDALTARNEFTAQLDSLKTRVTSQGNEITDLIHIGIGGSSLGTQLVYEALRSVDSPIRVHFISNIDAHQLVEVVSQCSAQSTLVFAISKTFTTAETLQNVESVLAWMSAQGVVEPKQHLYAVTANPHNALAYGVDADRVVAFPNWVGGRYSVWSSVSLTAALVLGADAFTQLLQGARSVDEHFARTPVSENGCYLAACLDHYYRNYRCAQSKAIFAYDHRLRSLVPYLQQLETESNGKDRQLNGEPTDQFTSPVVWGGVGTDVQHSVFQMLHQGTLCIPTDFILVINPDHQLTDHHNELLANGLAQSAALLVGQSEAQVLAREPAIAANPLAVQAKQFSGHRPSTTFLIDRLTPYRLGQLLAFYEHRTFCYGQLVNINCFDQMGVELGKRLARDIRPLIDDANANPDESLDASTIRLIGIVKDLTQ